MFYFLTGVFGIAYLLLVWFETHAFGEYMELFRIDKFIPILKKYHKIRDQGSPLTFQEYLSQYYSKYFIVKILTCPVCLTPWLSLIFCSLLAFYVSFKLGVFCLAPLAYLSLLFYKIQKRI